MLAVAGSQRVMLVFVACNRCLTFQGCTRSRSSARAKTGAIGKGWVDSHPPVVKFKVLSTRRKDGLLRLNGWFSNETLKKSPHPLDNPHRGS